MKKIILTCILAAFTYCFAADKIACEGSRPLKVLAIGNSFTLSLHNNKHFMEAIKAANANIVYAVMYIGGCPLERHWKNIELFSKDPTAAPYLIRSNDEKLNSKSNIPQMLAKDDWNIITIQQASHFSFKPETYEPYMTLLINYFKEKCPKAEIVIQQTWSYCDLFNRAQQVGAGTPKEMYTKLCGAYLAAAKKHRIRIIPTGVAVEKAREALKMNFGPLSKEDSEKYVYPNLPKSTIECGEVVGNISWRKGKDGVFKIGGDPIHLNYDGEYLQSFTWLKFLTPEIDIVNVNYVPKKIPAEKARILRQAAADAVNQGLK
ncbi:MAG: DUF4886 domain-containing protein [Kiritimatiellae bacterium]|nr:DUF4886 domain-containing protein [Kiritimatiellia bacterium]